MRGQGGDVVTDVLLDRGFQQAAGAARTLSTEGAMADTSEEILPGYWTDFVAALTAASTAPHFSWPSTTINGTPRTATAYSRLPSMSSLTKLPATRATNRSPRAQSKAYSGTTRESAQPSTAA